MLLRIKNSCFNDYKCHNISADWHSVAKMAFAKPEPLPLKAQLLLPFFSPLPCLSISRGVNLCATITFDIHTKKIKST